MSAYDELAAQVAAHGPFPMPTGEPQPVELTEEQAEALINAGNGALSDYYHERQCHCSDYPAGCVTNPGYRRAAGFWDTDAFAIGLPAVLGVWESLRRPRRFTPLEEAVQGIETAIAPLKGDARTGADMVLTYLRTLTTPDTTVPRDLRPGADAARRMLRDRKTEIHTHTWVTALDGNDQPALDGAGRTWEHCGICGKRKTAEDPHDSPLHRTYETSHDLPEVDSYRSAPLPAAAALCATCGHNGAAHHHAGTACWENLPREQHPAKTWDPIRLCPCSVFVEVTR